MEKRKAMRELTAIEDHFDRLRKATEDIEIFITSSYNYVNGQNVPCLGIRDKENRGVFIDDTLWLIYGKVFHSPNNVEIPRLSLFKCLNKENIYIELGAQTSIMGCLIQVDLGKRKIAHIEPGFDNDKLFAHLEVME